MKHIHKISLTVLCSYALWSCQFQDSEFVTVTELKPQNYDVIADAAGETVGIYVYASGPFTCRMLDSSVDWAEMVSDSHHDGDAMVVVSFKRNKELRRKVSVELNLDGSQISDTIYFKQSGINPVLECSTSSVLVDGTQDGNVPVEFTTNLSHSLITVSVEYDSKDSGWISDLTCPGDIPWDNDEMILKYSGSKIPQITKATIGLTYEDAWGEDVSAKINVCRSGSGGEIGNLRTFGDIRKSAGIFNQDDYIQGIVISDCQSQNMAKNDNYEYDKVDITPSAQTAYLESEDGSYGFSLVFTDPSENVLKPGMLLKLSLDSLSLVKEENPERYRLEGLTGASLMDFSTTVTIPQKNKRISELTDEDIYTFVNLQETEFAYKEGTYTNVHEGFSLPNPSNTNTVSVQTDGWGSILVDDKMSAIYAPVNFFCDWRRSQVPQGAGITSGIIVSEDLTRISDAGKYQIRVLDESGFIQDSHSSSYNRIVNIDGDKVTSSTEVSGVKFEMGGVTVSKAPNFSKMTYAAYGMIDDKAFGMLSDLTSWYNFNEEGKLESFNGITFNLPTMMMSGKGVLAHFSMLCWGDTGNFRVGPAHWCLEYAKSGTQDYKLVKPAVSDSSYVHLHPFMIKYGYQGGRRYAPSIYCAPGYVDYAFFIPEEFIGKEDMIVRLRPADDIIFDFPQFKEDYDKPIENGNITQDADINTEIRFAKIEFSLLTK